MVCDVMVRCPLVFCGGLPFCGDGYGQDVIGGGRWRGRAGAVDIVPVAFVVCKILYVSCGGCKGR